MRSAGAAPVGRIGVALAALGLAGCAPGGRPLAPALADQGDSAWLVETGFPLRERDALLHLDRREISALFADSLTQLLVRAPRVEVRVRVSGRKDYLLHRTADWAARPAETGCPLDFYVNGSLLQLRTGDIYDLQSDRLFEPYHLNGLEIFDAEDAPVGTPGGCGAVLFWVGRLRDRADPEFAATLHGRIVGLPGRAALADIPVSVEPGGLRRVTDARGRFDFGAIPPARYRLEAHVPGWGPHRTELMLRSGGVAEVEIEIERR